MRAALYPLRWPGPIPCWFQLLAMKTLSIGVAGGSIRNWSGVAVGRSPTPPSFMVNSLRSTGVMISMIATFDGSAISGMTRTASVISSRAFPDSMYGTSLFVHFFKQFHYQDKRLGIVQRQSDRGAVGGLKSEGVAPDESRLVREMIGL